MKWEWLNVLILTFSLHLYSFLTCLLHLLYRIVPVYLPCYYKGSHSPGTRCCFSHWITSFPKKVWKKANNKTKLYYFACDSVLFCIGYRRQRFCNVFFFSPTHLLRSYVCALPAVRKVTTNARAPLQNDRKGRGNEPGRYVRYHWWHDRTVKRER